MSHNGDDIEVPIKPPSRQVRSGDATAAAGGASPLFGRRQSNYPPEEGSTPAPSLTPSAMSLNPPSHPTRATDVVLVSGDEAASPHSAPPSSHPASSLPPPSVPGSTVVAMNSTYAPTDQPGSYTIDLDRITSPISAETGDVNAVPIRLSTRGVSQLHPWHYGLFTCCGEMDSCLESFFCISCQTSRQCNLVMNNQRGIHWPICLLAFCCGTSSYTASIIQCLLIGQLRQMVRRRYAVSGTSLADFGLAYCCSVCVIQQMLLEMTVLDDFPGATCYQAVATAPPIVEMV